MFILGLAIGLEIAILAFVIGYNQGADQAKELRKFREMKLNRITLHDSDFDRHSESN